MKKEESVKVEESIPVPVNKAQPIFSEETIRQFELSAGVKSKDSEKVENAETKAIEEKLDNLQNLLEQKLQAKEAETVQAESAVDEKSAEIIKFEKLLYNKMIEIRNRTESQTFEEHTEKLMKKLGFRA